MMSEYEDTIDITKINQPHIDSYMKKEEFMKILENMRFIGIASASIHFITGFEYDAKNNTTKTLGYDIDIS